MSLCELSLPWLHTVTIAADGILMDASTGVGVGAVLIIARTGTRELLMVRKSARPGFEGNDQWAFPGGMVRPRAPHTRLREWILSSLCERVAAEIQLSVSICDAMHLLPVTPPIVAAYTVKGQRRRTVLVPFTLTLQQDFQPRTQDPTVYDPGWCDPHTIWRDITPTNRLLAAYVLWPRLTPAERCAARPSVTDALEQASAWATESGFSPPIAPWNVRD